MTINCVSLSPWLAAKTRLFGDIPVGEAYMNGDMEVEGNLADWIQHNAPLVKRRTPYFRKSIAKAGKHYNIKPEFYKMLLGPTMAYTCGNFDSSGCSLAEAQANKYNLHAKWLELDNAESLLECGFGWGGFHRYIRDKANFKYTGITISDVQMEYVDGCEMIHAFYATNPVQKAPTPSEFYKCDWRRASDFDRLFDWKFDRFTAQGMLEHVGKKNLSDFFEWIASILKIGGIGTLQFISKDKLISPWADKYIFPGAYPPNINEVLRNMHRFGLQMTDFISRGESYVRTLDGWLENLESNIEKIKALGYDDRFIRMFRFYLSGGIASFRSGESQLIQLRFVRG